MDSMYISGNRERARVASILEGFGVRVQDSVFEVALRSPADFQRLRADLRKEVSESACLRFYPLCEHCRSGARDLGGQPITHEPEPWIQ